MTINDATSTIALSSLAFGYRFQIDNGPDMIFRSVEYPEFGSEAVITYSYPGSPGKIEKRNLLQINDHAFTAA